eukprot:5871919-Pleurochrysis_carterae.AAC.9
MLLFLHTTNVEPPAPRANPSSAHKSDVDGRKPRHVVSSRRTNTTSHPTSFRNSRCQLTFNVRAALLSGHSPPVAPPGPSTVYILQRH